MPYVSCKMVPFGIPSAARSTLRKPEEIHNAGCRTGDFMASFEKDEGCCPKGN